jgi:hypothetical protein
MPKQVFPAAAEGMPNFNRRTFLRGTGSAIAVAGAGVAPAVATADAPAVAPQSEELQRLGQLLVDSLAERAAAEAEIARIADEWRDRWPLAPEALLGSTIRGTALDDSMWRAERDIAGDVLERDVSLLTERLTKEQRAEFAGKRLAFYVWKRSSIVDELERLREREPAGRTVKALARNRAWRAKAITRAKTKLNLVKSYEAEAARLLQVSGMNAAKARLAKAEANVLSVRKAISNADARSPADLWKKAEVVRDELKEHTYDWSEMFPGTSLDRLQRLVFAVAGAASIMKVAS